jgi:hypothetical protein
MTSDYKTIAAKTLCFNFNIRGPYNTCFADNGSGSPDRKVRYMYHRKKYDNSIFHPMGEHKTIQSGNYVSIIELGLAGHISSRNLSEECERLK